jgi:hypothetical protein
MEYKEGDKVYVEAEVVSVHEKFTQLYIEDRTGEAELIIVDNNKIRKNND